VSALGASPDFQAELDRMLARLGCINTFLCVMQRRPTHCQGGATR